MTVDDLIQEICDCFIATGEWPFARALQVKYRKAANVRELARSVGWDRCGCSDGSDGKCVIQLREVARCKGTEKLLGIFVAGVRVIASSAISHGDRAVTSGELAETLQLDMLDKKRLGGLLYMAGSLWGSGSWQPGNSDFYLQPTENAVFFEEITSIEEYFEIENSLNRRFIRSANPFTAVGAMVREIASDKPERNFLFADAELKSIFERDLAELNAVLEVGAWKASGILAGACIEAVLLDLWKRSEDRARDVFRGSWPDRVAAHQLASAAVRLNMISDDHGKLVSVLRRSRNLVHPAAAMRSPEPREQLARALVAILDLVLADLGFEESTPSVFKAPH